MDGLTLETYADSFKQLEDILRCAICLDVLQLELAQCVNGHLLCSECKTDLTQCPTCRGDFSPEKPSGLIAQVLQALPRRCKHKNCGKFLNTDDDHEKYCGYKVTSCKRCNWKGPGKDILSHVIVQHSISTVFTDKTTVMVLNINKSLGQSVIVQTPFSVHKSFLWEKTSLNVRKRKFHKTFYIVPNGKPSKDIFVEVKFKSAASSFSCKMKLTLDPDVDEEENSIYVPFKMVPDFIDGSNKLSSEVYVTQE